MEDECYHHKGENFIAVAAVTLEADISLADLQYIFFPLKRKIFLCKLRWLEWSVFPDFISQN